MRKLIKNNVLPGTFASVTILFVATYNMDIISISALWHTEYWLLYTSVLLLNGVLFMIGDNQIINKIAGLCLICIVVFPINTPEFTGPSGWIMTDWLHHLFALGFFIIKPLNHHKYDWITILLGGLGLAALGLSIYQIEIIVLYTLIYQGYIKKRNYFRRTRNKLIS